MRILTVSKFGGSSVAAAAEFRLTASILRADSNRQVAVVSAPGRSAEYPVKVTDLLLQGDIDTVAARFANIMTDLSVDTSPLPRMVAWLKRCSSTAAVTAFGEYMSGYILAKCLGWRFVDARRVILVDGTNLSVNIDMLQYYLGRGERLVVPGFYGATISGAVTLLPRGGSDITGSLIAAALDAALYENWTDVDGVYTADPRHDLEAELLTHLSYRELRQYGLAGAAVFHADAVHPVATRGIPVHIRNTFNLEAVGTRVS